MRVPLVALAMLAGCASSPEPAAPSVPVANLTPMQATPPPPANATAAPNATANATRTVPIAFDGALDPGACVVGPAGACVGAPGGPHNAKDLGRARIVRHAQATVTWNATAGVDHLVAVLATVKGGAYQPANGTALVEGASPLTLSLDNVTIPDGEVGFYVTMPCQGVPQGGACPRTNQAFSVQGALVVED